MYYIKHIRRNNDRNYFKQINKPSMIVVHIIKYIYLMFKKYKDKIFNLFIHYL